MKTSPLILLVDESPFFRLVERKFLHRSEIEIIEASSVQETLALSRERTPQLIYLGFELPDGNGAQCCRLIKSDPRLRHISIVMVCHGQNLDQQELSRQAGCDALMTTPLDRQRFLEVGRSFLAGIRERRLPCRCRVRVKNGKVVLAKKAFDISSGGLFLECSEELTVGIVLDLELQLSPPDGNGPWLFLSGLLAWRNSREKPLKPYHPVGYGIKFVNLTPDAVAQLAAFLKTLQ
jgi:two-component system, OmpR family, alkaline phosphatase synthesis response regulator PhoP